MSLSIDVVDPQRGVILETSLAVEDLRNGIVDLVPSADGDRLYLIDNDAAVTIVDTLARTVVAAGQLAVNTGWHIVGEDIALSPDGKRLYAGFDTGDDGSQYFTDAIEIYDTATWQSIGTIELRDIMAHFALSAEGDQLYVVSPFVQSLEIFDTATYREVAVLSDLGGMPDAVIVPPAGR
ncbi:MAG: YncE family protein [Vicinamibacterales bacterium]